MNKYSVFILNLFSVTRVSIPDRDAQHASKVVVIETPFPLSVKIIFLPESSKLKRISN